MIGTSHGMDHSEDLPQIIAVDHINPILPLRLPDSLGHRLLPSSRINSTMPSSFAPDDHHYYDTTSVYGFQKRDWRPHIGAGR